MLEGILHLLTAILETLSIQGRDKSTLMIIPRKQGAQYFVGYSCCVLAFSVPYLNMNKACSMSEMSELTPAS